MTMESITFAAASVRTPSPALPLMVERVIDAEALLRTPSPPLA
jgi:hypothetical protein